MSPQPHVTRRRFLQAAAAALAAPAVVPASALGQDGAAPPSERITLGLVGIGAMGQGHLRCFLGFDDVQVVGVCDVDQWRRDRAGQLAEETYASRRAEGTYRGCDASNDLRDLVDRDDIDAVVVATGDNWHAAASVLAMRGGKDVYCEKPVSLTIREARAIADAAERYQRVVQIGLQQRSAPEFQRACALVRQGAIGAVDTVYVGFPGTSSDVNLPPEPVPDGLDWDLWLGPAPWRPFNARFHRVGPPPGVVPWHFCRDFGGGNLTSNAVHAFDVVQWGLGMDRGGPVEVVPPETGRVPCLTYKYPGGVTLRVTWKLDHPEYPVPAGWDRNTTIRNFGALFVGERGWVHVGREGFLECFPKEILVDAPRWPEHRQAVRGHQRGWLDAIRTRGPTLCDAEAGCRSTIVSHLGCIAHWTGRALRWDPPSERFLDDDEAQRMTWRPMRPPWGM
jgi:predicted dehydrogenase